ncbi:MAG: hypothetical protein HY924_07205 [Elusimicrobia bacterium]|nr:hypothetical protein [Elusimicrobiota bacterium]
MAPQDPRQKPSLGRKALSYVTSRRAPADAALVLAGVAGMAAAIAAFLALLALAPTPWGWLNVALAIVGGGVASTLASSFAGQTESINAAFGLETVETQRSLGPFSWTLRIRTGASAPASGRHAVKAVLPLAGLLLASGLVLHLVHSTWHGRVDSFKDSIRAKGWPGSLADRQGGDADSDYAYPELEKALSGLDLKAWSEAENKRRPGVRRWDRAEQLKQAPVIGRYEPFLLREAGPILKKRSRFFRTDYAAAAKDPLRMPLPNYSRALTVARMARLCAEGRAFGGELSRAWDHVRLILAIIRLNAPEHTLFSKMVAINLGRMAGETSVTILLNRPGAGLPRDVAAGLKELAERDLVKEGLETELAMHCDMRDFFERAFSGALPGQGFEQLVGGPSTGLAFLDRVLGRVAVATGFFDANVFVSGRHLESLIDLPQDSRGSDASGAALLELPAWPYLLALIATPDFARIYDRQAETGDWAGLALLASALAESREKNGRYPAKLEAVAPERLLPRTPARPRVLAASDFSYVLAGAGYVLCRVSDGAPRKDRNGVEFCVRP